MRRHIGHNLALASILVSPLFAQLHLITGSPSPDEPPPGGYESAVFRLKPGGSLARVATIVPAAVGSDWIVESQGMRKMVIGDKIETSIFVFDFDKVGIVKQCDEPEFPNWANLDRWLVDSQARGPVLALDRGNSIHPESQHLLGMVLDPSVACDKSFAKMDPGELNHAALSGVSGVAEIGGRDWMSLALHRNTGKLELPFPQGSFFFDQNLPLEMFAGMELPWTHVLVNNSEVMAVSITDLGKSIEQRLVVLRKRDKTWLRVPKVSEKFAARGFGAWVAITAAQAKSALLPESAGRQEWATARQTARSSGPNIGLRMDDYPLAYPGLIYLCDARTEQVRTLRTNQGDSEILLVDGETIYYRANDKLYSAAIAEKDFAEPKLLATDEAIRDAHWAFIKR